MLITLRDRNQKLIVKDMLDIDFDMYVDEDHGKYYVNVNHNYRLDEVFEKEKCAEDKMLSIAESRNSMEMELKNY